MDILEGLPGYVVYHVFDKGFKHYIGPNNQTFFDIVAGIQARTGGRVRFLVPLDLKDAWYDATGQQHPAPIRPPNVDEANLLWEVQANSTRTHVTAHRWVAEANFSRDWANKMTGGREEIPQQLLDSYGKPPTPQVPRIFVVNSVHQQIVHDFATPMSESYELPNGVTYADIGRLLVARIEMINWLDPRRYGQPSPFQRDNIFSKPTQIELRRAAPVAGKHCLIGT